MYIPKTQQPQDVWSKTQVKLQGETGKSTFTVGDLDALFSIVDRRNRLKISVNIEHPGNTISQFDLIDIYGIFQPITF